MKKIRILDVLACIILTTFIGLIWAYFNNPEWFSSLSKLVFASLIITLSYSLYNGAFFIIAYFTRLIPSVNLYLFFIVETLVYYFLHFLGTKLYILTNAFPEFLLPIFSIGIILLGLMLIKYLTPKS
jgi:hypothetical protein